MGLVVASDMVLSSVSGMSITRVLELVLDDRVFVAVDNLLELLLAMHVLLLPADILLGLLHAVNNNDILVQLLLGLDRLSVALHCLLKLLLVLNSALELILASNRLLELILSSNRLLELILSSNRLLELMLASNRLLELILAKDRASASA